MRTDCPRNVWACTINASRESVRTGFTRTRWSGTIKDRQIHRRRNRSYVSSHRKEQTGDGGITVKRSCFKRNDRGLMRRPSDSLNSMINCLITVCNCCSAERLTYYARGTRTKKAMFVCARLPRDRKTASAYNAVNTNDLHDSSVQY